MRFGFNVFDYLHLSTTFFGYTGVEIIRGWEERYPGPWVEAMMGFESVAGIELGVWSVGYIETVVHESSGVAFGYAHNLFIYYGL